MALEFHTYGAGQQMQHALNGVAAFFLPPTPLAH